MPRVLLVDDEPLLVRLLEVNFRAAGFEARTAGTGRAALAVAEEFRPDAVVLDLGLPDVDGAEVIALLRQLDIGAPPIVVLSGNDPDVAADRGYAASVQAFLTKPVEPADVVDAVRSAMGAAEA